jgi:hypothetical protein
MDLLEQIFGVPPLQGQMDRHGIEFRNGQPLESLPGVELLHFDAI